MRESSLGTLRVSCVGLGCMGMSQGYGPADDAESIATVRAAVEAGCTFLDTADVYGAGENERLIGRALNGRRDQVTLATKFGVRWDRMKPDSNSIVVDGSPTYARSAIDASLRRLGVDYVDLWYLHQLDPQVPVADTVGAMAEAVNAGKVRHLGLSNVSGASVRAAHAAHPIAAVQSEWSLWTRDPETDILPVLRELGIGFVAFSPLGRGFLTGRIRTPDDFSADDIRRRMPRFTGDNFQRNLDLTNVVHSLATEKGVTAAQLALAWLLSHGDDVAPIPGSKRRNNLHENMAAAGIRLTPDEQATLDAAFPPDAASGSRLSDRRVVSSSTTIS